MFNKRIYLDNNASTPILDEVLKVMIESFQHFGNPSSVHQEGRKAKNMLENSRLNVANLFNVPKDQVFFTSGATEAAATLLTPHWKMGRSDLTCSHLYVGATEHPCVLKGHSFPEESTTIIPVDENGIIHPEKLKEILERDQNKSKLPLVSIQAANSETGVIQKTEELCAVTRSFGGIFVVDAVQYASRFPIEQLSDFADFIFISGHKMGAPKGVGAFIGSGSVIAPRPLISGGGQERGLRAGTQPVSLIIGLGEAAKVVKKQLELKVWNDERRNYLEDNLQKICPNIIIHAKNVNRLPNTCYFSIPNKKAETLQIAFDLRQIAVSSGSACSSSRVITSHTLQAMGKTDDDGAIRISMGLETSIEDIDYFLESFAQIISN